ncbi:MAG: DUF6382 domain-containing protein [Clostridia bacterium]|nr:DUF6382 domain-containing protein [Clostridia bacterium]
MQIINTLAGRYLVIEAGEEGKLLDFQARIIKANPHPQLLPLEKRKLNGEVKLYYPLGGLVAVTEYAPEALAPEDILWILEGTLRCLQLSAPYLLSPYNFLLEPSFVFLEPSNKTVALAYLPLQGEGEINPKLRALMEALIRMAPKAHNPQEAVLLKSLADFPDSSAFGPEGLKKLLRDLKLPQMKLFPERAEGAGRKFYLDPAAKTDRDQGIPRERGEKKSVLGLPKDVALFLGLQAGLIVLVTYFLGFMQSLRHPLLVYGLVVLALTAGNILAIDRLLLRKKMASAPTPKETGWQAWLIGKLAGEYNVLCREIKRQRQEN